VNGPARAAVAAIALVAGCVGSPHEPREPVAVPSPASEVVATFRGEPITVGDLETSTLGELILDPLFEQYRRERGIVATEAEIERFLANAFDSPDERTLVASDDSESDDEFDRQLAEAWIVDWKTSRSMYEEFGGEVIFQQTNPLEPIGAYRAFLRQQARNGAFAIHDAGRAAQFWAAFSAEHAIVIPPERVDYSVPWWEMSRPRVGRAPESEVRRDG